LKTLSFEDKRIKIVESIEAEPSELVRAVREQKLEGIVGKRKDSVYEPGTRSGSWIKHRLNRGQEFAIGGCTPGLHGLDAIMVGYYREKELVYVSRTRNGFVPASQLFEKLKPLVIPNCPFVNLPEKKQSRWGLVLTATPEIRFARQSKFVELREDKDPRSAVREHAGEVIESS
jgi:ATP-dependent DNA ligase